MKKLPFLEKANKKPKVPKISEYTLHCQIAQYLNLVIKKPSRWHTVEVSNHGYDKAAMINQGMDKKKGVRTGWPDIEIFWRPQCSNNIDCKEASCSELFMIFLEVKVPGGNLTDKQEALHKELREEGHGVFTVYSVEDVEKVLKELGVV